MAVVFAERLVLQEKVNVMKKRFLHCLLLLLLAAPAARAADILTIASGPMGGAYYPAGVGLGELIGKHVPEVSPRVEVTAGAIENPSLLAMEEADVGITNSDTAYFAANGMPPFSGKIENIAAMFNGLAPGGFQYIVLEDSPIKTIRDLPGKRIAVGPQGNSSSLNLRELMAFYGDSYDDIHPNYLPVSDGVEQMLDGHVDMAIVQAGIPAPAIQEAFASGKKIRFIEFPDEDRKKVVEQFPYFRPIDLTKEYYPSLGDDIVEIFCTNNIVIVRKDLPEDLVYKMTAAIFDNLEDFHKVHPAARWVSFENATETPIPLHPGAARYFKEKGYLK